jgi:hypothetical protein
MALGICPACNTPSESKLGFCSNCGEPLAAAATLAPPIPEPIGGPVRLQIAGGEAAELTAIGCLPAFFLSLLCGWGLMMLAGFSSPLAVWLVVLLTAGWVYVDSRAIGVRRGLVKGMGDYSATGWVIGCLLIWIFFFPMYLIARPHLKRMAPIAPLYEGPSGLASISPAMLVVLLLAGAFLLYVMVNIAQS